VTRQSGTVINLIRGRAESNLNRVIMSSAAFTSAFPDAGRMPAAESDVLPEFADLPGLLDMGWDVATALVRGGVRRHSMGVIDRLAVSADSGGCLWVCWCGMQLTYADLWYHILVAQQFFVFGHTTLLAVSCAVLALTHIGYCVLIQYLYVDGFAHNILERTLMFVVTLPFAPLVLWLFHQLIPNSHHSLDQQARQPRIGA
jgi:hypothetical protein